MTLMIHHQAARISAPRLAAYMGIETHTTIPSSLDRPDYLIRYGSRRSVPYQPEYRTLNRRRMLDRYPTRLEQLQRLRAAGVSVPDFFEGGYPTGEPILGRDMGSDRQSTQGRGITFYPRPVSGGVDDHDFYMRYIPKDRQFRVHVIGSETRTRELIPNEDTDTDQPVWNYESGFTYRVADSIPVQVVPAAVQAVKALWLDFGAVDIITHNGMAYVLEINTAPGLADPTLEWYAEQFASLTDVGDMPGWDADGIEREDET